VSLYHSICHEKYFPLSEDQTVIFADFVDNLLKKNPTERLGMLHGGIMDILQHKWFQDIELSQIQKKSFPAPWKPTELIYDGFENQQLKWNELHQTNDSSRNKLIDSFSSIISTEDMGDTQELSSSSDSNTGGVKEITISAASESEELQKSSIRSDTKSKSLKQRKKTRKQDSKNCDSKRRVSTSNSYSNPSEFQFVSLERAEPLRNPNIRRTLLQKKNNQGFGEIY